MAQLICMEAALVRCETRRGNPVFAKPNNTSLGRLHWEYSADAGTRMESLPDVFGCPASHRSKKDRSRPVGAYSSLTGGEHLREPRQRYFIPQNVLGAIARVSYCTAVLFLAPHEENGKNKSRSRDTRIYENFRAGIAANIPVRTSDMFSAFE